MLRARLDVYEETVILRTFSGEFTTTKVVSPDDIATAFTAKLDFSSGLLPANCLWWKRRAGGGRVAAVWRDPQVWSVALQTKPFEPPRRLQLPMPGLLFVCGAGSTPYIFAAPERPQKESDVLYKAPCFNVFNNHRVCPGTHQFPADPGEVPESFFTSFFSRTGQYERRSKSHPDNLLDLWDELDGTTVYPMTDLMECGRLLDALSIV